MKNSLKDIANGLNLSKTTVSWVLTGQGNARGISNATQEKVLGYARKLNYRPNLIARSLKTYKTETLGLIIPDITDSFYSSICKAVEREADKINYSVMIGNSESDIIIENKLINLFKGKQVDGMIIAPTKISKKEIQSLTDEYFPFVLIDRYFPEMNTNYVIVDNKGNSERIVNQMINDGAKKIAIVTTNQHLTTMNMRYEGYALALQKAGIAIDSKLYCNVPFNNYMSDMCKYLDDLFMKAPDIDGLFFATHILAIASLSYFYDKGIDMNKRFKLGCIHSEPNFKYLFPKMHIAQMPVEKIGKESVAILSDNIDYHINNINGDYHMQNKTLMCI
jgi:LacI family transcriptional regulator